MGGGVWVTFSRPSNFEKNLKNCQKSKNYTNSAAGYIFQYNFCIIHIMSLNWSFIKIIKTYKYIIWSYFWRPFFFGGHFFWRPFFLAAIKNLQLNQKGKNEKKYNSTSFWQVISGILLHFGTSNRNIGLDSHFLTKFAQNR